MSSEAAYCWDGEPWPRSSKSRTDGSASFSFPCRRPWRSRCRPKPVDLSRCLSASCPLNRYVPSSNRLSFELGYLLQEPLWFCLSLKGFLQIGFWEKQLKIHCWQILQEKVLYCIWWCNKYYWRGAAVLFRLSNLIIFLFEFRTHFSTSISQKIVKLIISSKVRELFQKIKSSSLEKLQETR